MSDTPNNPAPGAVPPKVAPKLGATVQMQPIEGVTPAAPKLGATVQLKPIEGVTPPAPKLGATVRLQPLEGDAPAIRKPVPGGAPAHATTPAAAIEAAKKLTGSLKAVTGPIPAAAVLHQTGIVAEGLPSDNQAAKTKTSRISLNAAMGVAPTKEAAPLKTIRLKRPTGLPATPAAAPAAPAAPAEPSASVTQKKTLKLHRPGGVAKRPTLGINKPAEPAAPQPADAPVADLEDIPELSPTSTVTATATSLFQPVPRAQKPSVPGWFTTMSVITSIAALLILGAATFFLVIEGLDTQVDALRDNTLGCIQTAEDHHIDMR